MKLVYLGTPEVAVPPLRRLVEDGHDVALVVSQPDRRRSRGGALLPSPVKAAAIELGLTVTDKVDDALDAEAELGVVVAFGRLIKPHVLAELPMVNVHFSLLPRWRGAAPVERALLAGDSETGVCLMQLEAGLDTGPVYECVTTPVAEDDTLDSLRGRLVDLGTELLSRRLRDGLGEARPQQGDATHAAKIDPSELHLDWTRPAVEVHRIVRLGRAWTTFRGQRLQVTEAALGGATPQLGPGELDGTVVGCGDGHGLELRSVKPEGRAVQPAAAWRNGARPVAGELLGEP